MLSSQYSSSGISIHQSMADARELSDAAIGFAEQGDYDEAIRQINAAIRMDSNNPNLWYNKGIILYKQGNIPDAVNSFGQAADIDPGFAEAWYNKGLALESLGRFPGAIHAFDKVLAINRYDKQALFHKNLALEKISASGNFPPDHPDHARQSKLFR